MKRIYSLLMLVVALFCAGNAMAAAVDVLTFPDYNDKGNGSYTDSWTATKDEKVWTISGFNNNNSQWAFIKAGNKSAETTSTITTPAYDVAVTDVVFTVDFTGFVTAATVEVLNGEEVVSSVDIYGQWKKGEVDAKVEGAAGNSYRLTIVNSQTINNGMTQISQIALYGSGEYTAPETQDVTAVSDKFWNFSDFTAGDITETTIIDNLELVATSSKKLSIDSNNKSIDNIDFTGRLKTGGTGSPDGRFAHFKVEPNSLITVYGMSGSNGTERTLNIDFGQFGLNKASLVNDGTAIGKVEYEYTGEEETDVYIYSTNSGFNVYGIKVEPINNNFIVNLTTAENGTVTADVTEAAEGATVTLTVTPAEGYELDALKVTYIGTTEEEEVTVADDNTFVMPASDVYVSATFKQKVKNEPGEFADTPLSKDMYKTWDGFDDYAKPTEATPAWDEYTYGNTVEGGAVIYGNGSVFNTTYADITGTTVMRITGTPGLALRVMMNRQADNSLTEIDPTIGDDGKVEVDLSSLEYVHLNAIKVNWGASGAVESIILNPSDAEEKVKNEPGEYADTPLTKDMYKSWDGFDDYAKPTSATPAWDEYTYGTEVGQGSVIYGNGSVLNSTYADITGASIIRFTGTPGLPLRVMMNRQADNSLTERRAEIGEDGQVDLDISDLPYVHVNAIKVAWGDIVGAVESIILNPSEETPEAPEILNPSFELAAADTPLTEELKASNGPLTIYGWTETVDASYNNTEIRAAGSSSTTSQFGTAAPTDGEYALFFRHGWNGNGVTTTLTSAALSTLPAGSYKLSIDYKQHYSYDNTQNSNTTIGIAMMNGDTELGSAKSEGAAGSQGGSSDATYFNDSEWSTLTAAFTVEEDVEGATVVISFNAGGQRRSDFFIDNVKLELVPAEEVAKDALKEAIDAANASNNYVTGDNIFQYPESEISPLTEAIAAAQAVYDNESATVEEINAATETLNNFVEEFNPSFNEPVEGQAYIITQKASGLKLSLDNGVKISETGSEIFFVEEGDGSYALTANNTEYVGYIGTGNNTWSMGLTTATAWDFTALADGGYLISGINGYVATDNITEGSPTYGNKAANNANGVWMIEAVESEEILKGDINKDKKHSIVDVTMTVGFALDKAVPTEYEQKAADMDDDEAITVADAAAIVNLVMDFDYDAAGAKAREYTNNDYLVVNGNTVSLENSDTYVAFQMDVTVNGAFNSAALTARAADHQLAYNQIGENKYRVLVLSNTNSAFSGNAGELISFDIEGTYELSNVRFVDAGIRSVFIGVDDTATGIGAVRALENEAAGIYTMGGVKVNKLQKGMNIVRKADGTAVKVFVK